MVVIYEYVIKDVSSHSWPTTFYSSLFMCCPVCFNFNSIYAMLCCQHLSCPPSLAAIKCCPPKYSASTTATSTDTATTTEATDTDKTHLSKHNHGHRGTFLDHGVTATTEAMARATTRRTLPRPWSQPPQPRQPPRTQLRFWIPLQLQLQLQLRSGPHPKPQPWSRGHSSCVMRPRTTGPQVLLLLYWHEIGWARAGYEQG